MDSERFLRLRQTISEKIKDCHKGGSNSRILAVQFSDLTTMPTMPTFIKIGLRKWIFFGVKEFFLVNLDFKN